MAEAPRTYRWWEQADQKLLQVVYGRIEDGAAPKEIYDELDIREQCGIELRTFQEWATNYKRLIRIERAKERASYRKQLCAALGIETEALDPLKRLKLSTIVETIASAAERPVKLRATREHELMREGDRREQKAAREAEKHDWLRQQRERKAEADKQVETVGRDEGLSDAAIEQIKSIYGLALSSDDHD